MSKEKSNSEEFNRHITAQRMKEVELIIENIDEILEKDFETEEFEACAKLRDAKLDLQEHLNGNKEYEEIKEQLYYAKQKFSSILPDALKSNRKNP